ncbi:MAG TPA: 3-oxoacyl-[acyl-carrier-protein] synthase III C-terminal domain-containing protein [Chitinophagales bacterium]|nr:3-oxoacyl-[acyl-carrier-protein] synthase III C-terminal domain-containing protein [Chitinophagales bacterium]
MPLNTSAKPGISGAGYYVPDNIIGNNELEKTVKNFDAAKAGRSFDDWVQSRYGINERRRADNETASYQAYKAVATALADAGLNATDLDFLILNTSSGDYIQPTTASTVQQLLGMRKNTFAMEINLPCGGPMYGIATAVSYLLTGKYKHGAVVGVDKMFAIIDNDDFRMGSLFGEGAASVIVSAGGPHIIEDFHLASAAEEGEEKDFALTILAGNSKYPASVQTLQSKMHYLKMNGPKVEAFAVSAIVESVSNLLGSAGLTINEIDFFVPHQAAYPIINKAFNSLNADPAKVLFTLDKFGNTSAASVLLTFAYHKNRYQPKQKIILTAMGAGLNWGGVLVQW